jgi:branched-subunit amino acid ABC-type transport system permease component
MTVLTANDRAVSKLSRVRVSLRPSRRRPALILGTLLVTLAAGVPLATVFRVWPFVIAGIADGSIYSLAALGLVLTYKTSGIFNFAIGAQAAASAYVFYTLRVTERWPWPLAALGALALVGLLCSLVLERVAFWLTDAPPVMRVAATIGVLVLLQSLFTGLYGQATIEFRPFLPERSAHIGSVNVSVSQIIIVLLSIAATMGLYFFFKRARLGVAMEAVVEDPNLLALGATSPVVVRRWAWAIGSGFISVSGMLLAPQLGIDVNLMLLVYIAAFGAAALASFSSLLTAFVGSMAIGITSNVISDKLGASTNPTLAGLYTQVPFLILVAALLLVPKAWLVERGTRRVRRLRPALSFSRPVVAASTGGLAILAGALPYLVGSLLVQYTTALCFAIVLISLGLLLWTSGQISLCQMAFAAVGATTFSHAQQAGLPWLVALLASALVAVPIGALVAIPAFRLSGIYLAVATFGFGVLFQNLIYRTSLMFGSGFGRTVSRPHFLGAHSSTNEGYYYTTLLIAAACGLLVVGVRRSRLGRLLRGLADSPMALDAHGANTRLTRVYVFCIAAVIAAVGGALLAGVTGSVTGDVSGPFGYFNSLVLVAVLAFCGRQPLISPLVAALLFEVIKLYRPFSGSTFVKYQGVGFGLLAIGVAVAPGIGAWSAGRKTSLRTRSSRVAQRLELVGRGPWN